jgi:hypothetical protein
MNDKKAKLLRKTVYGPIDYRQRDYKILDSGQIINKEISLRSVYQKTKRLYNEKNKA